MKYLRDLEAVAPKLGASLEWYATYDTDLQVSYIHLRFETRERSRLQSSRAIAIRFEADKFEWHIDRMAYALVCYLQCN